MRTPQRGFSLLETMIALILVGVAMTALLLAFVNSGKYGVLSRRQATALIVARSMAETLGHVNWVPQAGDTTCTTTGLDSRLLDNISGNNATYADPGGLFAGASVPTGSDAPDSALGTVTVGNETYDTYVNTAPQSDLDPSGSTVVNGMQYAVIVRYRVGEKFMRAVAVGYRLCPFTSSIGQMPL